MDNTLKNKTLYVYNQTSGSQGVLTFGDDTSGTYKVGPSTNDITWAEKWAGDFCYLWVVWNQKIEDSVILIWGIQLAMHGDTIMGTGMSANGNAYPQNLTDTSFQNDDLTISSNPI